jgi:uncharacterized protein (TIGR02118 family)
MTASFVVLYSRPDDAEGFLQEYLDDHVPIAKRFPGMTDHTTTVLDTTPRGTDPAFYVMFRGVWDSMEDLREAMRDPSLMEASKHAMGMLEKYGNTAEMMIGEDR